MATKPVETAHTKPAPVIPLPVRKPSEGAASPLDPSALRRRRSRIAVFFTSAALHFLWWDCFLQLPLLRLLRTPSLPRWQAMTRRFKDAAIGLEGVWIKFGQFLSTRVDVLPLEITSELESLRDELPAETIGVIVAQIEADFGRPIERIFSSVSPRPIGSASLAQVHRARTLEGDAVVVKVLRPGIRAVIDADVALLRQLVRVMKWIRPITRRADLNALINEFCTVTYNELDLSREARNVEQFARDFASDPAIGTPRIFKAQSSTSTLTMEDVSFLRIDAPNALEAAGISPKAVAGKIYTAYLQQFFVTYRIHADPHPGNLFVRPLPVPGEPAPFLPGQPVSYAPGRPFQIVFVDFGMFVEIPPRLRDALRMFAIGLGTRDAGQILDSYARAGVLTGDADMDRLEEMVQQQLDELWGTFLGQVRQADLTSPAARAFFKKYADLMSATPFQFQTEMLFAMRAMGILSGLTSGLDPNFNAWAETEPFARRLMREDLMKAARHSVTDLMAGRPPAGISSWLRLLPFPGADRRSGVRNRAGSDEVRRLRTSVNRLTAALLIAALFALGTVYRVAGLRTSDFLPLLWPGNDPWRWVFELAAAAGVLLLLRREPRA